MTTRNLNAAPAVSGMAFPTGSLAVFVTDLAVRVGVTPPLVREQKALLETDGELTRRQARLLGLLESALISIARVHGVCSPAGCQTCRPVRRGMAALVADAEVAQTRINRAGAAA
ncbi:hypothetical protein [Micromonospora sp. RV43]|uniref:hypothetical protein n=1 Tax=Micromonospora sp. RV43 TaxID=1661387 RepID=UPI00064BBC5A|nr:hypothetical protein [Micromonospora sp. RV43]